jgi:hypothetical protein
MEATIKTKDKTSQEFIGLGLTILEQQGKIEFCNGIEEITETFNNEFNATLTVNDLIPFYQIQLEQADLEQQFRNLGH